MPCLLLYFLSCLTVHFGDMRYSPSDPEQAFFSSLLCLPTAIFIHSFMATCTTDGGRLDRLLWYELNELQDLRRQINLKDLQDLQGKRKEIRASGLQDLQRKTNLLNELQILCRLKMALRMTIWRFSRGINNRFNPPWVHARPEPAEQGSPGFSTLKASGRLLNMEQLWEEFFADPSQWWDNRFTKKSSKHPDFKHKSTLESLWVDGRLNPCWVNERMVSMALGHIQSGDGLKSRARDCFCNGDKVRRLCQEGRLKEALHMVELMVQQTTTTPIGAYLCLLKGCSKRKALAEGKQVHALIAQSVLDSNIFLANTLVHMYSKCGSVLDAHKVFSNMPQRNVYSWTAIISAYADSGQGEEAINLFQQMQRTGLAPDKVVFVVVLKACASLAALEQGKQLHSDIIKRGFQSDVIVGSTLVDMYAKCGCTDDAREMFNNMSERNVVSWSAMIAGYAQNRLGKEALALYEQMKQEGVQPDIVTFTCVLSACASLAALEQGKQLHSDIIKRGFQSDVIVGNTLVDMYVKCGCTEDARELFNNMSERNVVSWNAMIAGYAQNGLGKEALALYEQMKQEGEQPNHVTFVVLLKACASLAALEQGKQLHSDIIKRGFQSDVIVGSTLVDMYAKCGCTDDARELFNSMSERDVVSWNAMIAGYAQNGLGKEALALYEQMKQEGVQPDNVTFTCVLSACAHSRLVDEGRCIFDSMRKDHGATPDVVSWSAMIAGYAQNGLGKEALALYEQMKQEGVQPNNVTFVVLLKACASLAALEQGKQLHSDIIKRGFQSDVIVGSTLVDMYAKCGCTEDARELFNDMSERNVVSWNAMIAGYAQNGLGKEALALYEQMKQEGVQPNNVTFTCVLSACAHSRLVDEGRYVFDSMCKDHDVTPTEEHYACMVDLLARAGCWADAELFINKMPIQPDSVVWMTLLGAARNHGHVEIGRRAFDLLVKLEPKNAAPYVLLSNIYAAAGRKDELAKIRNEMMDAGVKKCLGAAGSKLITKCMPLL
ncbi:hypothetical protein O6H91_10G090900 [Diphasiastrum complanatum]|uniref:Uncharacterized protein n=1 Tax=Diphasiastrum complanatum TaxID=34168 RepID=A0ACC2CJL6_DIPCM|nr:hypothetical protein O6H91_10G090900 [Diphasiastrum complanatum]